MSGPVSVAAKARLRRVGGRWVRRLGLLPGGEPDRLGEDDRLSGLVVDQRVMVFFPDVPTNLYQLAQWYEPLRALDERHGVVIITADSRTTRLVRQATSFAVHCVARTATLDQLIARSRLELAMYVGHHINNFAALRYPTLVHVYVGHGESDKDISASNQLKAYDFAFVAGAAAVDRIKRTLALYDVESRTMLIGRPQLDGARRAGTRSTRPSAALRVLYAPTWEGAQPSVAYSSVATHGAAVVRSLLDGGAEVTYRPHPRTGANDTKVRMADAALRALVSQHPRGHVDTEQSLDDAFEAADVLVTDISSVALDWLPTMKPLVVTVPARGDLEPADSPLLATAPRLAVDAAEQAFPVVSAAMQQPPGADRSRLVDYYLGDVTPGAAMKRFLDACERALATREQERRRLEAEAT